MRGFGSDNQAGVHPEIFKALSKANVGHAPSYDTDEWSEKTAKIFEKHFGSCLVSYVFNGTAANVLALRAITKPYQAILCSDISHINNDECGAPEFFTGAKLRPLATVDGKITLTSLQESLIRKGDQHFSQAGAISLTQPTEYGTCYSTDEIKAICDWAHAHGIYVHVDGARLANAVLHLNTSFKKMLADTGVDIVSMGGTKNGFLFGEAVVVLNPKLQGDFKYIRKQSAQLPSKSRFVACQFAEYLEGDLWKRIAQHSMQMAQALREGSTGIPRVEITQQTQSNAVFAKVPQPWVKRLKDQAFFYVWDEQTFECRWITSWDTQLEDIKGFTSLLKELSKK